MPCPFQKFAKLRSVYTLGSMICLQKNEPPVQSACSCMRQHNWHTAQILELESASTTPLPVGSASIIKCELAIAEPSIPCRQMLTGTSADTCFARHGALMCGQNTRTAAGHILHGKLLAQRICALDLIPQSPVLRLHVSGPDESLQIASRPTTRRSCLRK